MLKTIFSLFATVGAFFSIIVWWITNDGATNLMIDQLATLTIVLVLCDFLTSKAPEHVKALFLVYMIFMFSRMVYICVTIMVLTSSLTILYFS